MFIPSILGFVALPEIGNADAPSPGFAFLQDVTFTDLVDLNNNTIEVIA